MSAMANRLAKWRMVFASWQLGTRPASDPECQAVRDHRETTLLLRAEVNALVGLLIKKGLVTEAEVASAIDDEAAELMRKLEARFPGFTATDDGMRMKLPEAAKTMKGWPP